MGKNTGRLMSVLVVCLVAALYVFVLSRGQLL